MNQSFFPDVHWYNFLKKKLGVDSTNVSWERKSNATSNCTRHGGQHIANMFFCVQLVHRVKNKGFLVDLRVLQGWNRCGRFAGTILT